MWQPRIVASVRGVAVYQAVLTRSVRADSPGR